MSARRTFLTAMAASLLGLAAGRALAAPTTVEIVAMAHPPVQVALAPLRQWLATQGDKFRVVELNVETPQGEKRLRSVGLDGHVPILILIDGQYRHRGKDGSQVAFVNFPAIKDAPPGVRGEWTTADVQAVLAERIK